mmetsp:Transcript_135/g.248  ORF Transcript_135/g.248 Transcript_135/m.248 type:complete len:222 (-) Transcript_135:478-1143(-)
MPRAIHTGSEILTDGRTTNIRCALCDLAEEDVLDGFVEPQTIQVGGQPRRLFFHQQCLLWSPDVGIEMPDPAGPTIWTHIEDLYARGRKLKCTKCKKMGATVGCDVRTCPKNFHFPCALSLGCKFVEDLNTYNRLFCPLHVNWQPGDERKPKRKSSSSSSTSKPAKSRRKKETSSAVDAPSSSSSRVRSGGGASSSRQQPIEEPQDEGSSGSEFLNESDDG